MSRHRTTPLEKKLRYHDLPRGPNGRRLCRWCKVEVKPPKLTFCGPDCVHEYKLRSDAGYLRTQVYLRDKGVCGSCGLDTEVLTSAGSRWPRDGEYELAMAWLAALGAHRARTLWEADHIVPVSEGGGECGLENMRTLCVWCHKRETAELNRRRAATRRST